ncbi:GNAT family protein [Actinomadura sp. NPDC048394]|uniref:GNAT family N-acetyltransferase n=1 Tax=Actinomadura sp. NPDC048394 TaxID=3158223 RepID=UPI0033CB89C4
MTASGFPGRVPVLGGTVVRLEPLAMGHVPELAEAAEEDRSSYGFTPVPSGAGMEAYVSDKLDRPGLMAFAQVRVVDGRAVGHTALLHPRPWPGRDRLCAVEIGWTWLSASAQGTGVNVEAKRLLFGYAFETLGVARVELKTDARNERARRAIERLGAHFEGVLRRYSESWVAGEEGELRDTAMYSVVESEWPSVKAAMANRLADAGQV